MYNSSPTDKCLFDQFLRWLDSDRNKAGEQYERIRRQLVRVFLCRGATSPEDLADRTIDRVAHKVSEPGFCYIGDPMPYFLSVGRHIFLEFCREQFHRNAYSISQVDDDTEVRYQCLDTCLETLSPKSKELALRYYAHEKREKIDARKNLAESLDLPLNALRIQLHRIRVSVRKCVVRCMAIKENS